MGDGQKGGERLVWIEALKGLAMLWIVLNHLVEILFGSPYFANPSGRWPPLAERIAQAQPLAVDGIAGIAVNLLRWVGWCGDQGVQIFLIVSGFGLAWSLLQRNAGADVAVGSFFWRRAKRIYPLWWAAHLLLIVTGFLFDDGLYLSDPRLVPSLLGVRFLSSAFAYGAPAWWYIGLQLQLYLVFPLLWALGRKRGAGSVLVVGVAVTLVSRAVGLLVFDNYLDPWLRGAFFPTRLAEFAFGIWFAYWLRSRPADSWRRPFGPTFALGGIAVWALGFALSFLLWGNVAAIFLLGLGAFVVLGSGLARIEDSLLVRPLLVVGRYGFGIFLVHHVVYLSLLPDDAAPGVTIVIAVLTTALSIAGGIALERGVDAFVRTLTRLYQKRGLVLAGAFAATALGTIPAALVATEWSIRTFDPQEVLGWGERPSLAPDEALGWTLKPGSETRLRWQSYDYRVRANSLGFPGPEPPAAPSDEAVTILVTGDAFSSAEGVDTDQAWPRLLPKAFAAQGVSDPIEVLNFSITGYGPQHYASVVERFAPIHRPDIVVVASFVNDFNDVRRSDDAFHTAIGFENPPLDSRYARIRPLHTRAFLKEHAIGALRAHFLGTPSGLDLFFAQRDVLLAGPNALLDEGTPLVGTAFARIGRAARQIDARTIVVLVPAPIQVCEIEELPYLQRLQRMGLLDGLDDERPQRLLTELAEAAGMSVHDLRPALRALETCPHFARNIHWTAAGHEAVAADVALALGPFTRKPAAGTPAPQTPGAVESTP